MESCMWLPGDGWRGDRLAAMEGKLRRGEVCVVRAHGVVVVCGEGREVPIPQQRRPGSRTTTHPTQIHAWLKEEREGGLEGGRGGKVGSGGGAWIDLTKREGEGGAVDLTT